MPNTVPDLIYIGLSALIAFTVAIGIPTIAWFIRRATDLMISKMTDIDKKVDSLSTELRQEREDRMMAYHKMIEDFAAHKAVCNHRHKE